jgi:hypothetical protein
MYIQAKHTIFMRLYISKFLRAVFLFIGLTLSTVLFSQSYLGLTTSQVNLRKGPGTDFQILESLKPNSNLFIISSVPEGDFYNVVDISTNKEGYVHKSYVRFLEQVKPNEEGIFTPTGRTNSYGSELTVKNDTKLTLTLKFNETTYSFSPNETKILNVSAGTYSYRASAPGVIPDFGTETMQSGTSYSWTFYIVTSYR